MRDGATLGKEKEEENGLQVSKQAHVLLVGLVERLEHLLALDEHRVRAAGQGEALVLVADLLQQPVLAGEGGADLLGQGLKEGEATGVDALVVAEKVEDEDGGGDEGGREEDLSGTPMRSLTMSSAWTAVRRILTAVSRSRARASS